MRIYDNPQKGTETIRLVCMCSSVTVIQHHNIEIATNSGTSFLYIVLLAISSRIQRI